MSERIKRPQRDPNYPPRNQTEMLARSGEDAIYTHKNALAEEHFLRTGHAAERAVVCEVCELIVAGTDSDPRKA